MLKYFILLLYFILSVNLLAQVVIKDEIVLDEINAEDSGLNMPFYGKVKEFIKCDYFMISQAQADLIIDGTNYSFPFCQGAPCPNLGCYCNGTGIWSDEHIVPMGKPVDTEIRKCYGGPDWVILNHYFVETTPPPGVTKQYIIYAKEPEGEYKNIGAINFTEIPDPPGCDNAQNNYCNSTTFHTPNVYMILEEDGYADPLFPCKVGVVGRLVGAYIPEHSQRLTNRHLFNENSLDACFNKDTQKWQFNFFSPSDFEIHLMLDYCEENMAQYFVLEDINDVGEIFDCYFAEICFNKHRYQRDWSGVLYPGCYLIKEVVTLHEQLHFTQRINDLIELKEKYNMNIELWEQNNSACSSFLNPAEAKQKALKYVKNQFTELTKEIRNRAENYKDSEEINIRSSALIDELIDDYLDALYNHCYN